jgi:hypothetical protein
MQGSSLAFSSDAVAREDPLIIRMAPTAIDDSTHGTRASAQKNGRLNACRDCMLP